MRLAVKVSSEVTQKRKRHGSSQKGKEGSDVTQADTVDSGASNAFVSSAHAAGDEKEPAEVFDFRKLSVNEIISVNLTNLTNLTLTLTLELTVIARS